MLKTEIASLMNESGRMFNWATKVDKNLNMTSEDKEISQVVDAWAKSIGEKGIDTNNEIAEYIVKTVQPEVYDVPDEMLSAMFTRGSVGEFDDFQINTAPKNTLKAIDAAKGGNVDKSYLDFSNVKPTWKHKQVETEIRYSDLRRNGFKTIATMTTFAEESLKNQMFFDVLNAVDTLITSPSAQGFAAGGSAPTPVTMDALALYLMDRGSSPFVITLSKYAQAIARMTGQSTFMSDTMKDEYNRYGTVNFYNGIQIRTISGAHKTSQDQLLIPDLRIFGIASPIGELDMRGSLRVYETMDNNKEVVDIKITGFEFGYALNRLDKIAKVVMV